ncbi:alpha/beta hydrolase [uncultured Flavobacterium sp.]|uniref:alpha/beta hydrolase n=1 Tax=uncultured Flavobacterium sp. TaxID=165435 RepID=UPI0030CA5239
MATLKFRIKHVKILIFCFVLGINGCVYSQTEIISVWPDTIPNVLANKDYQEIALYKEGNVYNISKVTTPTLSVFLPENDKFNNTSVIICPGGGYSHLAMDKEGTKVAQWLNSLGIAAFVLKYRLPSDLIMKDKSIGPLQDAQEALRIVRRHAEKWKLNINKIGIMGFSAGGHLAATLSTHYNDKLYKTLDSISARPNFSILIYPVISMIDEITHKGSRNDLLGANPTTALVNKFSNELCVNSNMSPAFIVHATDDKSVPVENSLNYYQALKRHNVPAELHIFEKGGHGFGLGVKDTSQYWTEICENWLRSNKYIN